MAAKACPKLLLKILNCPPTGNPNHVSQTSRYKYSLPFILPDFSNQEVSLERKA